jgi:hypothetical protein
VILNPYVFASGGGGGGSWATWNTDGFSGTYSNGNRTITRASGGSGVCRSTSPFLDFTYAEFSFAPAGNAAGQGLCNASQSLTATYLGVDANGAGYYLPAADVYRSAVVQFNGATYSTTPAVVGIAVRGSVGSGWNVWIRRPDSTWEGGGNPVTNTTPTFTMPAGTYYPACTITAASPTTINAGQGAFVLWTPSGGFAGVPA